MSFLNASQKIQKFVNNYGNQTRNYDVIDYVLRTSNANTSINLEESAFVPKPGRKRRVEVNYWPIQCDVEGSCDDGLCATGTTIEPKQIDFDITQCTATAKWKINEPDIRLTDAGDWTFTGTAQQIINSALPAARKLLAVDMLTYLYTKVGLHTDGSTTQRVQSTNTATGVVNPIGKLAIEKEFLDGGFMPPNILGSDEAYYFKKMVQYGTGNNNGLAVNRLPTDNLWYDDGLQGAILDDTQGGGHILAIDPQVFKFVTYHENVGIFQTDIGRIEDMDKLYTESKGAGFILGSLRDPVTGIVWDLYVNFEKCDATTGRPAWTFSLKLWWDMFVMPDITCSVQGVNGIMHYRTCPPVLAPCPTGDAIPSPAAARIRAWNPSFTYPLNIYESTIGGVTVTHDTPVAVTTDTDLVAYMNDNYGANIFSLSGSQIIYTGYTNLGVSLNDGAVTGTFA